MNTDIWQVIADIGIELHPDRVNAIAGKIAGLTSVDEFDKAISGFGPVANKPMMNALERVWRRDPRVTPLEVAAALRGASGTASMMEKREAVDMVWTGPCTGLVASRHTEQVLLEVIDSARWRLFIVSFVAYNIDSVKKALQDAVGRNVKIEILLESSKAHGGKIDIDSIDVFKKAIPSANVYAWNSESKTSARWNGAVHAKCAVADGSLAFITSANLTRAAMENNMELGVLVRGGNLPEKLERHLEVLVTTGVIEKI
ncbi:DISARM system phospholipase D-like protein DrmC [Desulforhopalus vacuolatus]|uniref:DISARM system phospholipase D-like protein DrmC n=1 Tax=Desulforhopalus vacuolatus TaxID=40414 RepID=UPI001966C7F5|nr:DISARM system phospholipase D-like protein DrmC [Desulforhopalus vacuolatus]MBM9518764.1 DISARM system phospholipase D-like protein DrmC [Desulforhopalus vacuolatus]